ncbi:MAG: Bug family tripartite tricarboxylate transporter substrate binding protein [Xanthobacteraceae bacterium]
MARGLSWWLVVCFLTAATTSAAAQEPVAQFYRGKQITVVVGSSAGGGYDIYARLLARHMSKHIPGNPTIVITNMPGAASTAAAAYVYNTAPKDGTVIGALQNTAIVDALLDEAKRVRFDASKFVYLGSATTDYYVCIARTDAPVKSFIQLQERKLVIGASQPGTSTRDFPVLLNNLTGAKFRIVTGYPGTREITLAIEKGEVQGLCGFSWSSLVAQRPDWIQNGFIRVLVQEHAKGHSAVNRMGVPLAVDFAKGEDERRILELFYSSEVFGRPYMMPPGMPEQRITALRAAFMATMRDPDLTAEAQRIGLDVDPISGEELQTLAERIYASPAPLIAKARQALVLANP